MKAIHANFMRHEPAWIYPCYIHARFTLGSCGVNYFMRHEIFHSRSMLISCGMKSVVAEHEWNHSKCATSCFFHATCRMKWAWTLWQGLSCTASGHVHAFFMPLYIFIPYSCHQFRQLQCPTLQNAFHANSCRLCMPYSCRLSFHANTCQWYMPISCTYTLDSVSCLFVPLHTCRIHASPHHSTFHANKFQWYMPIPFPHTLDSCSCHFMPLNTCHIHAASNQSTFDANTCQWYMPISCPYTLDSVSCHFVTLHTCHIPADPYQLHASNSIVRIIAWKQHGNTAWS